MTCLFCLVQFCRLNSKTDFDSFTVFNVFAYGNKLMIMVLLKKKVVKKTKTWNIYLMVNYSVAGFHTLYYYYMYISVI